MKPALKSAFALPSILLAGLALISQSVPAAAPKAGPAPQPKEVFLKYWKALADDDLKTANDLIATFPNYPAARVVTSNTANLQKVTAATSPYKLHSSRTIGECAAVVIYKTDPESDQDIIVGPAYLILRDNSWKLLPGIARYDREEFEFTNDQLKGWVALENWFDAEEEKLRTQIERAFLQKPLEERVVGIWVAQNQSAITWTEIKPGGAFQGGVAAPGKPAAQYQGRWRIENKNLIWKYAAEKNASEKAAKPDEPDIDLIIEANTSFLVLQEERRNDRKTTLRRVSPSTLEQLQRDYRDK